MPSLCQQLLESFSTNRLIHKLLPDSAHLHLPDGRRGGGGRRRRPVSTQAGSTSSWILSSLKSLELSWNWAETFLFETVSASAERKQKITQTDNKELTDCKMFQQIKTNINTVVTFTSLDFKMRRTSNFSVSYKFSLYLIKLMRKIINYRQKHSFSFCE